MTSSGVPPSPTNLSVCYILSWDRLYFRLGNFRAVSGKREARKRIVLSAAARARRCAFASFLSLPFRQAANVRAWTKALSQHSGVAKTAPSVAEAVSFAGASLSLHDCADTECTSVNTNGRGHAPRSSTQAQHLTWSLFYVVTSFTLHSN